MYDGLAWLMQIVLFLTLGPKQSLVKSDQKSFILPEFKLKLLYFEGNCLETLSTVLLSLLDKLSAMDLTTFTLNSR